MPLVHDRWYAVLWLRSKTTCFAPRIHTTPCIIPWIPWCPFKAKVTRNVGGNHYSGTASPDWGGGVKVGSEKPLSLLLYCSFSTLVVELPCLSSWANSACACAARELLEDEPCFIVAQRGRKGGICTPFQRFSVGLPPLISKTMWLSYMQFLGSPLQPPHPRPPMSRFH